MLAFSQKKKVVKKGDEIFHFPKWNKNPKRVNKEGFFNFEWKMEPILHLQSDTSAYSFKDLIELNSKEKSWRSKLSCIAHIDMNAFFAQCEQIRLGLSNDDPIVCVQWGTIIAVSYNARDYGISRLDRLEEAKLKCPHLIIAHTAVFKKNEPVWKYVDYTPSPKDHKVSLDPYRRESRKIMNVFKSNCDLIEKASVDECFLDLGRLLFDKIMQLFPNLLQDMKSRDDPLPIIKELPPNLKFDGFIIPKAHDTETQYVIEDWDDLITLLGSNICYELRMKIKSQLGYLTSGGVGRVKTIAKLASDFKKPDQQTVVRNGSMSNFLSNFEITDFWSLGGKTGQFVRAKLGDGDLIKTIRNDYDHPYDMYEVFDNDKELCEKLFSIVRGELRSPLEPKESLKSMGANKNFRGNAVSSLQTFQPWLKVFIGELIMRLQELDEEMNSIVRPRKLTLSFNSNMSTHHSKQCTISSNIKDFKQLEHIFWDSALRLGKELQDGLKIERPNLALFPLRHAGLTISGLTESSGINTIDDLMGNVRKRPKLESSDNEEDAQTPVKSNTIDTLMENLRKKPKSSLEDTRVLEMYPTVDDELFVIDTEETVDDDPLLKKCDICEEVIFIEEWVSHKDYHLAVELNDQLNTQFENPITDRLFRDKKKRKLAGGQSQLPF